MPLKPFSRRRLIVDRNKSNRPSLFTPTAESGSSSSSTSTVSSSSVGHSKKRSANLHRALFGPHIASKQKKSRRHRRFRQPISRIYKEKSFADIAEMSRFKAVTQNTSEALHMEEYCGCTGYLGSNENATNSSAEHGVYGAPMSDGTGQTSSTTTSETQYHRRLVCREDDEYVHGRRFEHTPGLNDLMRGAIDPFSKVTKIAVNDKLDCTWDLENQFNHMPWRILTSSSLAATPGLFQDPEGCEAVLGEQFLTTNTGLRIAILECQETMCEGYDLDTLVLGALAKRGGTVDPDRLGRDVIYPEDIQPVVDEQHPFHDEEYWKALDDRGSFWNEMPP